jgi:hypothetical protein
MRRLDCKSATGPEADRRSTLLIYQRIDEVAAAWF